MDKPRWRAWLSASAFGVSWAAGAALGAYYLRRGWVPHDEGALAQSAERLLAGQLPHRDFDEIYTGGLSVLHALSFRVLGHNLWSMRVVLFAAFVAFLPAVYYIARRFVESYGAALALLVAAAWSLPNYSAPIPSWYNLFFAVFGTAALLRYVDTRRARWLFTAGLAGGLSCLSKITGLYFIAAAVVFLVYHESVSSRDASAGTSTVRETGARMLVVFEIAFLATVGVAVALLVRGRAGVAGVATFVVPVILLVVAIGQRLWGERSGDARGRLVRLWALGWPFLAGFAAPVLLFALPYVWSGSLGALWNGVFVLPTRRFSFASMGLLPLWTMRYGVLPLTVFWWSGRWTRRTRWLVTTIVTFALLWFLANGRHARPYEIVWYTTRAMLPLAVIAGSLLLLRRPTLADRRREHGMVLVLSVAALCSLVQFPFAAPIYFVYVAPLTLLAAIAVYSVWNVEPQPLGGIVLGFYFLFAILWINTGFIYAMGINHVRDRQSHLLALPRGGVNVAIEDKSTYERTVAAVQARSAGEYIWAGPDAPEVYFLSGKKNPTRTLFDFFDDPSDRMQRVLGAIDQHDVRVIVLHSRPPFSGPLPATLRDSLARRFPNAETVGWFQIRWRE